MNGPGGDAVVDFWNVGQGDATSIRLPSGELILIDVGPKNSTLSQWLRSGPRGRIRDIILTHNDADHAGALPEIVAALSGQITRILMLEDRNRDDARTQALFRPVHQFQRVGHYQVQRLEHTGQPFELWKEPALGLSLRLRHPQFLDNALSKAPNDASAILSLDQNNQTLIVWPGDACVSRIVGVVPPCPPMLFGPHHGAPQDRKNQRFFGHLAALAPGNCFVSVGTRNHKDKHPNDAYVEQLSKNGCRVVCSQMTRNCDATRVKNGDHVMNTSGYWGLPAPAQGVFCRGHVRLTVSAVGLAHDRYHDEHRRRLAEEHRKSRHLLCASSLV